MAHICPYHQICQRECTGEGFVQGAGLSFGQLAPELSSLGRAITVTSNHTLCTASALDSTPSSAAPPPPASTPEARRAGIEKPLRSASDRDEAIGSHCEPTQVPLLAGLAPFSEAPSAASFLASPTLHLVQFRPLLLLLIVS